MATSQEQWNTDEKLSTNSLILSHVMSKCKRNPKWEAFKEQASIKRQGKKKTVAAKNEITLLYSAFSSTVEGKWQKYA